MSQSNPESKPPEAPAYEAQSEKLFSAAFVRVLLLQLAFGVSFSSFLLLPKFLRTELHASATEIGWMAGIALVVAAVLAPFIGLAVKQFDRRILLTIAILAEGLSAFGFLYVTEVGPFSFMLRAIQGLAWVIVFNTTAAMTADRVPRAMLARAIGYLGVTMLTTNALAPLVTEPVAEHFGWRAAFSIAAIVVFSGLFIVPFMGRDRAHQIDPQPSRAFSGPLNAVYFGSFAMGTGLGVMFTFVQPFALEQGATKVGTFFLGYVVAAVSVRVGLGGFADRVGPPKVSAFSLVGYALVLFAAAMLTPGLLIALGAGLGLSHGFLYPALSATGLGLTSPSMRAVFLGWFTFSFNTGFAIAVLGLGPVADRAGYPIIFTMTGALIAISVIPLVIGRGRSLVPEG